MFLIPTLQTPNGLLQHAPLPPESLPAIAADDLILAWQAATQAAHSVLDVMGPDLGPMPQGVLFERPDGDTTVIHFADRDAACWALGVACSVGLDSLHGLAVCFRLLGLIDQLSHQEKLRPYFAVGGREGPEIHPAILRTAASLPLNREASFDGDRFVATVHRHLVTARP